MQPTTSISKQIHANASEQIQTFWGTSTVEHFNQYRAHKIWYNTIQI